MPNESLLISDLLEGYRTRRFTPVHIAEQVLKRIDQAQERHVWIARLPHAQVLAQARQLAERPMDGLPLYGIPFAIKDNIDLAGVPTTAGCPDYAYVPHHSAYVVQRLIDAGAIPVGKTNLDQFATGLVGTRSPYGACRNSFHAEYIAGGSSSGSAVAVATGLTSFALGTDTAGSGRVPAAFNNVIGLKPSCGRLSTRGVVPACRSLDCVSVFALTAADAARVLAVAAAFDAQDAYARAHQAAPAARLRTGQFSFGVPRAEQLEFFGDRDYARQFLEAAARMESLGGRRVEIDAAPFLAAARLLYEGPWVAERYAAIADFLADHPGSLHPVTHQIISGGAHAAAVDAFRAQYRLMELKRASEAAWRAVDVILMPTAGTIYRIDAVQADPIRLNANLGYYTNFVNLLDLAAVAVPAGFRADGLPFGVSLIGRAFSDEDLLVLAARLHRAGNITLGALGNAMPSDVVPVVPSNDELIPVAVCGAHMEGLPLNHQLKDCGAVFLKRTHTARLYRLYALPPALPGGLPERPGLVRTPHAGAQIEVEVWGVPAAHFGAFVAAIPAPLGIGKIQLEDGELVPGFVCESYAVDRAADITVHGGWRRYLASRSTGT